MTPGMGKLKAAGNGSGSVYRDNDPRRRLHWAANVTIGWRPDGRPVRRVRYASSKREAEALLSRMVRAMSAGAPLPDDRLTVGTMLIEWFANRTDLAPATRRSWGSALKLHVIPTLGWVKLQRLRPSEIEAALRNMPPGYAAVSRALLVRALTDCQHDGMIDRNPAKLARGPKIHREAIRVPTAEEARKLIAVAMGRSATLASRGHEVDLPKSGIFPFGGHVGVEGSAGFGVRETTGQGDSATGRAGSPVAPRLAQVDPADDASLHGGFSPLRLPDVSVTHESRGHRLGALIVTALGTGLRQGELLGLRWTDIDGNRLTAARQLIRVEGEPVIAATKTHLVHVVDLPPFVLAALDAHFLRQSEEKLRAGRKWQDADGLVFTTAQGAPLHGNTARWVLDVLCERAGIERVRFHSLRHAAGTMVAEIAGQKAAQGMLGHASVTMTDKYAHGTDDLSAAAAQALQEAMG